MAYLVVGAAFGAMLGAAPVQAQTWAPAEGCDAFLTVQMKGCFVANYWRCDAAPEGTVFEATHDEDGRVAASIYDADFQWLDTLWEDGWRDRLIAPSADPISTSTLVRQGWDAYDFQLWSDGADPADGVNRTRVRGMDVLMGETVTIDGLTLQRTLYQTAYADPAGEVTAIGRGHQFFSAEYGLFFFGEEEWIEGGVTELSDNTPVDFILPGEAGFGAIEPGHGCDASVSGVEDDAKKSSSGKQGK